jgi:5-methylcytosine-specific restriction endonuclease McrA
MPIAVVKAASVVDGAMFIDESAIARSRLKAGDVAAMLTALDAGGDGPAWTMPLTIGAGPGAREMQIPLKPLLTAVEYQESFAEPRRLSGCLWLYRDGIYATERPPMPSEASEVVLRVKAIHLRGDSALRRLREQVANLEAVERNVKAVARRLPIPDDVKLLVWSRDGGVCVKCGSAKQLHFDHIIPYSRGGGDDAENLQILCQTCNLAKGDRLA